MLRNIEISKRQLATAALAVLAVIAIAINQFRTADSSKAVSRQNAAIDRAEINRSPITRSDTGATSDVGSERAPSSSGSPGAALTTGEHEQQAILPATPAVKPKNDVVASRMMSWELPYQALAAHLAQERQQVDEAIHDDQEHSRDDMLVMYGKSASASGDFKGGAAAYLLFLEEFGTEHPYSPAVAIKLGDCLAPLDHRYAGISHAADGPQFKPQWRMRMTPDQTLVAAAVQAYELAAHLAPDDKSAGEALFSLGWVQRTLGDWDASASAWQRCASTTPSPQLAHRAIMGAADNLELMGRPAEAAALLRSESAVSQDEQRVALAAARANDLEFAAARDTIADSDPVSALEQEISQRSGTPSHTVYRSFVQWLNQRGNHNGLVAVHRWARTQGDWPAEQQTLCRLELVDELLHSGATSEAKVEAAAALAEVIDLAPQPEWAFPTALRRSKLLRELGDFAFAEQSFTKLSSDITSSPIWEPQILAERVRIMRDAENGAEADRLVHDLAARYPYYVELKELAPDLATNGPEEEVDQ